MNIPLTLKCPNCGEARTHRVHLNDAAADFMCPKCNSNCTGIPGLDVTIGILLLHRSNYELEVEKDYDMAIVLAAAAVECELSCLYCKWKEVEALGTSEPFDADACEEELRRMGRVTDKIINISSFLYSGGIESFVQSSDKWKKTISEGFLGLRLESFAMDFQRAVFWPRNAVLHQGKSGKTKDEALSCCRIAWLGVHILKEMDKAKLHAFQSSH